MSQYYTTERPGEQWLYVRDRKRYGKLLLELATVLDQLFPRVKTWVDDDLCSPPQLKGQDVAIYEALLHGLTALNHPYRQRQSGGAQLVATREDQVIALSLLQPKSLPETMLTVHLRRIYTDLLEAFYGEEFTVGTAMRKLRLPRSNVRRYVVALEHCGLLDRIGGNKRSGYRYVVIDWPWLDRSKG